MAEHAWTITSGRASEGPRGEAEQTEAYRNLKGKDEPVVAQPPEKKKHAFSSQDGGDAETAKDDEDPRDIGEDFGRGIRSA